MAVQLYHVHKLLKDYIQAMCNLAERRNSNLIADYQAILEDAKERCESMNIAWNDSFMPEYVSDHLREHMYG